ncbi:MAG: hypothetical protein V1753_05645 [Pseudomonadota bacterium]
MANTESVLNLVREAEDIVTDTLEKPGLTPSQRIILNDLSDVLRETDNLLLLNDLNESIEELKVKSKKLESINGQIKKQIKNLEKVSDKVAVAAKAIDAIVKAFGSPVSALC